MGAKKPTLREWLLSERNRIDADERFHYASANVQVNAPLALEQLEPNQQGANQVQGRRVHASRPSAVR